VEEVLLGDVFGRPVFEVEGEEHRAFDRRLVVGRRFLETHLAIELDRDAHRRQRVEQELAVADRLGRLDRRQRQIAADAETAPAGLDVQPLHFAEPGRERSDADAAGRLAVVFGVEQASLGCGIGARQRRHLLFEVLKTQIDAEPGGVVAEELANPFELARVVGGEGAQGIDHGRWIQAGKDWRSGAAVRGGVGGAAGSRWRRWLASAFR
jgi:hypothetical protein